MGDGEEERECERRLKLEGKTKGKNREDGKKEE